MKRKVSFVVVITLIFCLFSFNNIYANEDIKNIIAQKADLLVNKYNVQSLQYALIDNNEITISGQAGSYSKNSNTLLTNNSMYGIGSVSKMFVTTAIMQLVEDSKINIDTPIINYIPEFKMNDERYTQITPRMLLNHSSGIMGTSFNNTALFDDNDTYYKDNLLNILSTQRLKANPGEYSVYCNDGFGLAEILVERVSGIDFTTYIHQNIIEPLEMENTKTPLDDFDKNQVVKIYNPINNEELPIEMLNAIGTGGIYSTAEDLCRFSTIFTDTSKNIISQDSINAMQNEEYKRGLWLEDSDTNIAYGLGWDCVKLYPYSDYDIKAINKGGDTSFFHAQLVVLPEYDLAAAVVSSGGSSIYGEFLVADMLLNTLKQKGIIDEIKPAKSFGTPIESEIPEQIKNYSGIYATNQNLIKVDFIDNKLTFSDSVSQQYQIYTCSNGSFISNDGSTKLDFIEQNNQIYISTQSYINIPELGFNATSMYYAQRLEPSPISEKVTKVWKDRESKIYLVLNEKYTSERYMTLPVVGLNQSGLLEGYLETYKIIDENHANNLIQLPIISGRDLSDIEVYIQDNKEFVKFRDYIAVDLETINPISSLNNSKCTIQDDGYTQWFFIDESVANKTIEIELPSNGSFAVYDSNGLTVNYSTITNLNSAILPENGYVAFIGDVNTEFNIKIN